MNKQIEVAKAKGLIDGAIRKLEYIKFNLSTDNITNVSEKFNDVYGYLESVNEIATNIMMDEMQEVSVNEFI